MSFHPSDVDGMRRAAAFLKRLYRLPPNHELVLDMNEFQDMVIPIEFLGRATWEEKARWFADRQWYACTVREHIETGNWVFRHVPREVIQREAAYSRDNAVRTGCEKTPGWQSMGQSPADCSVRRSESRTVTKPSR